MPRYKSGFFGNLTRLVNKNNKRKYRKKTKYRRKKQMGGFFWRPKKGVHY